MLMSFIIVLKKIEMIFIGDINWLLGSIIKRRLLIESCNKVIKQVFLTRLRLILNSNEFLRLAKVCIFSRHYNARRFLGEGIVQFSFMNFE